jgi:hypothetical protein
MFTPPAAVDHCTFIPPYLLRRLAETDDEAIRSSGRSTLATDAELRARRAVATRQPAPPGGEEQAGEEIRVIHTADNTETLPGRRMRADGDPVSGDAAVDEAFDSSGQVLSLFADQFGRNSVDGQGGTLSVTVHYGDRYDNAFWDGAQLVFGDGDGEIFDRFTKPMDVMAHEFTHGVTQYTAGLTYQGQSGALNESVSDVFASMAKQRAAGETAAAADWLIGEGLFLPSVNGKALRSMIEPGTAYDDPRLGRDPQVGSMDDYVEIEEDNGGVHINSGIPNRAFALAANAIGGFSWERAGKIWYETLTAGDVGPDTDFAGFAQATVSAAGRLFPDDVTIAQKVRQAWSQVEVLPSTGLTTTPSDSSEPGPSAETDGRSPSASPALAGKIAIRRTGGVAGVARMAELDLDSSPHGPTVRQLLLDTDLHQLAGKATPAPDRFVYTVEFGSVQLSVPEHELTAELRKVVQLVLDNGDRP